MGHVPWSLRWWPGLAPLWQRGAVSGLVLALVFAALLNLTIATTWIWTEAVTAGVRWMAWGAVLAIWGGSAWAAAGWGRAEGPRPGPTSGALFQTAVSEYLQGNWLEAERVLRQLLGRNARDLEARLLLATLYRHTERLSEAAAELDRLATFDGSEAWEFEIGRERALLSGATAKRAEDGVSVPWTATVRRARAA